ncbi:MAG: hypothetical protein IH906_08525, partial [Proteobacteria bacterium]|nr:hypothetical protein [Pseudomonadota bacterium]
MLRGARNIARLVAIVATLARHDALDPLDAAGFAPAAALLRRLFARTGVA